jgi:hypothetical protein
MRDVNDTLDDRMICFNVNDKVCFPNLQVNYEFQPCQLEYFVLIGPMLGGAWICDRESHRRRHETFRGPVDFDGNGGLPQKQVLACTENSAV